MSPICPGRCSGEGLGERKTLRVEHPDGRILRDLEYWYVIYQPIPVSEGLQCLCRNLQAIVYRHLRSFLPSSQLPMAIPGMLG